MMYVKPDVKEILRDAFADMFQSPYYIDQQCGEYAFCPVASVSSGCAGSIRGGDLDADDAMCYFSSSASSTSGTDHNITQTQVNT